MTMTRRALLGGAMTLGGAAALRGASHIATGDGGGVAQAGFAKTIHLEPRVVTWELTPGKKVMAMGYNGRVPGPEIRVKEGTRLRAVVKNSLLEPTTVHWHGVQLPNGMDGVGGITQKALGPGETFVYEFDARPAGTRWYHTHVEEHRQMDVGLSGALIIEPAGPEPMAADRDVTLVLDDWRTGTGTPVPPSHDGTGAFRRHAGPGAGHVAPWDHAATYDTMTINGKAHPATETLRVKKGERVRLRIINASGEHTHVFRVTGHRLHVTHTDGNPLQAPVEVDAIPIAPSERYDAVVVADRPGAWLLTCLQPGHAEAGERMAVVYEGHEGRTPDAAGEAPDTLGLWQYGLGRGRPLTTAPTGATHEVELTLSGGMDEASRWTINGKVFPHTDPIVMKRGDRARVRFVNVSPDAHPMHLHGHAFGVVALGRARPPAPLIKDTVDVAPHMGSVTIEFTALAAGTWFLHCHKSRHMEGGMLTVVKIT